MAHPNASNFLAVTAFLATTAVIGRWFRSRGSESNNYSSEEAASAANSELGSIDDASNTVAGQLKGTQCGGRGIESHPIQLDDADYQESPSCALPSPAIAEKPQLSVEVDVLNHPAAAPSGPASPVNASPSANGKNSPNAKSPSAAATVIKVIAYCTSTSTKVDTPAEREKSNPLERALVVYKEPKPAAAPTRQPGSSTSIQPAAPSRQDKEYSFYQLFGDGDELIANCHRLLASLSFFYSSMRDVHSRATVFFKTEWWMTREMGIEINLACRENPDVASFFYQAAENWLKSYEAIAHVVFVLATREVPPAFAADAEKLGSLARSLMALCAQWEWVLESRLLSAMQTRRWHRAIGFQVDVLVGDSQSLPHFLVVPYIGVYHDVRLRRSDVLLAVVDNELVNLREIQFLESELIEALTARDAALAAEQELQAQWAAYEAEQQALKAQWAAHAAAQAEHEALVEAARRQKEEEEAQEHPENYIDINFLDA